jgi:hypothetical protein
VSHMERRTKGCSSMRHRIVGLLALALSPVLPGQALGFPPMRSTQSTIEGLLIRTQASSVEERAQRARDARAKVERNRRCRPSIEKDYAAALDGCKRTWGLEQTSERQRCFAGALKTYHKRLDDCPG